MSERICDLCGRWDSTLTDGICLDCRHRLKLDDPGVITPAADPGGDLATPPYTQYLAHQVRDALGEICALPSQRVMEDIITEALFVAAQDVLHGGTAELEYIGSIRLTARSAQLPAIHYHASDFLLGRLQRGCAA